MAKKKDPGFEEFLEEIKGKVAGIDDPEKKAAWSKVLSEDADSLKLVFRGGLREADYYRRLNAINEEKQALNEQKQKWDAYEGEFRSEYDRMKARSDALEAQLKRKEADLREAGLDDEADEVKRKRQNMVDEQELGALKKKVEELAGFREEATDALRKISAGSPAFTAAFAKAQRRFAKEGYDFDEEEVLHRVLKDQVPIEVAFEDAVRDQRKKREQEERRAEIEKAKEEARQEERTKHSAPDSIRASLGGIFGEGKSASDKLAEARSEALKLAANFGRPGA